MALSPQDVSRIAHLARLELTADEQAAMLGQLNGFFRIVEQMSVVDTRGVEPLYTPLSPCTRRRCACATMSSPSAMTRAQSRSAPVVEDGLFLVPKSSNERCSARDGVAALGARWRLAGFERRVVEHLLARIHDRQALGAFLHVDGESHGPRRRPSTPVAHAVRRWAAGRCTDRPQGHLCHRRRADHRRFEDPGRLRQPFRRHRGGEARGSGTSAWASSTATNSRWARPTRTRPGARCAIRGIPRACRVARRAFRRPAVAARLLPAATAPTPAARSASPPVSPASLASSRRTACARAGAWWPSRRAWTRPGRWRARPRIARCCCRR